MTTTRFDDLTSAFLEYIAGPGNTRADDPPVVAAREWLTTNGARLTKAPPGTEPVGASFHRADDTDALERIAALGCTTAQPGQIVCRLSPGAVWCGGCIAIDRLAGGTRPRVHGPDVIPASEANRIADESYAEGRRHAMSDAPLTAARDAWADYVAMSDRVADVLNTAQREGHMITTGTLEPYWADMITAGGKVRAALGLAPDDDVVDAQIVDEGAEARGAIANLRDWVNRNMTEFEKYGKRAPIPMDAHPQTVTAETTAWLCMLDNRLDLVEAPFERLREYLRMSNAGVDGMFSPGAKASPTDVVQKAIDRMRWYDDQVGGHRETLRDYGDQVQGLAAVLDGIGIKAEGHHDVTVMVTAGRVLTRQAAQIVCQSRRLSVADETVRTLAAWIGEQE